MKKAFKFLIETSQAIEQKFETTTELCRELYNAALTERRDAFKWAHQSINFIVQANQLSEIKKLRPEFKQIHSQVIQDVLKRMQKAFDNFFRHIKEGAENPGYPRYKSKSRYDSFTYPQSGWKIDGNKL